MTAKTKRIRVDVAPHFGGLWWVVVQPKQRTIRCLRQEDALLVGTLACRLIEATGGTAQLMLRSKRGRYSEERSYPDTTPRRKG